MTDLLLQAKDRLLAAELAYQEADSSLTLAMTQLEVAQKDRSEAQRNFEIKTLNYSLAIQNASNLEVQPYLSEKDYQDYKRKHKNTLIKTLKLSFEWEDIRYIVVKRKQDIKTISELLQNLAPDIHPQIFTTQQILEDVIGCNHNRQLSISDAK